MARLSRRECLERADAICEDEKFDRDRGYSQLELHRRKHLTEAEMLAAVRDEERVRRIVEYGRAEGLREAAGEA